MKILQTERGRTVDTVIVEIPGRDSGNDVMLYDFAQKIDFTDNA